ncbi:MAG: ABC transporter ATP-binding protein [Hyphomicrobiales bacterium]|nr:ABC transporter ATP-binding protein [Hyphomicrobiales bacterium]
MTALLSIEGLTLRFRGADRAAVNDVALDIAPAETVALVGESGSGKTMTALSIPRLGPEDALAEMRGSVRLGDENVLALDPATLRRVRGGTIGVVFQDPAASLNPIMSIGRQIREALPDPERLDDCLEEVGLAGVPGIAKRYPHELSGGQQQRVGIAMALAGDPELLIADEPTTALDVTIQAQILSLLAALQERRRMAMLFISHDFGVVARLAHRIVVMRAGQVVEQGPTDAVLHRPQSAYAKALLACRPTLTAAPARLATLDGTPAALPEPEIGAPLLEIADLTVRYPPRSIFAAPVTAVDRVSLTLRRGEALGLVGESGSGKSSLAKAVVGLAPIGGGRIWLDGEPIPASGPTTEQRKTVQYIFQDSYGSLNPRHTVATLVREALDLHRIGTPADRDARVRDLLKEVAMGPEFLDRLPRELSGGQRQRVAIARALALEPQVLICDEIVSALDVSVQAHILNLLKDLMARRGLAVLFISHDLAVVRFVASSVAVMRAGNLLETGPADRIVRAPEHPYTSALISASRQLEATPD